MEICLESCSEVAKEATKHLLIGKIHSDKPVNRNGALGVLRSMWGNKDGPVITEFGSQIYGLAFQSEDQMFRAMMESPWTVMGFCLILKRWEVEKSISEISFDKIQYWVQVHELPLEMQTLDNLKKIGSSIGRVVMLEKPEWSQGTGVYGPWLKAAPARRVLLERVIPVDESAPIGMVDLEEGTPVENGILTAVPRPSRSIGGVDLEEEMPAENGILNAVSRSHVSVGAVDLEEGTPVVNGTLTRVTREVARGGHSREFEYACEFEARGREKVSLVNSHNSRRVGVGKSDTGITILGVRDGNRICDSGVHGRIGSRHVEFGCPADEKGDLSGNVLSGIGKGPSSREMESSVLEDQPTESSINYTFKSNYKPPTQRNLFNTRKPKSHKSFSKVHARIGAEVCPGASLLDKENIGPGVGMYGIKDNWEEVSEVSSMISGDSNKAQPEDYVVATGHEQQNDVISREVLYHVEVASKENCVGMAWILKAYCDASVQMVNLQKSSIVFSSNTPDEARNQVEHLLQIPVLSMKEIRAEDRMDFQTRIVFLCWQIWKARCAACLERKGLNVEKVIYLAERAAIEFISSRTVRNAPLNSKEKSKNVETWEKPRSGLLKINCDGAFEETSGLAAIGVIVRDENGVNTDGMAKHISVSSGIESEALALKEAVSLAVDRALNNVTFETDSEIVQQSVNNYPKEADLRSFLSL
ncbi:hypothetical protein COLO4_22912 [Corchorus olitorius]|uniref:Uncharacterized protein n=1 Tax=Corchorus olitorius TaxID=93759 RepID=A0A1R3IJ37_9ROSI|nr:hypothetical protein COLO4_22912 [Corchorus olitorius]